jgi:hypothetical protein
MIEASLRYFANATGKTADDENDDDDEEDLGMGASNIAAQIAQFRCL